MASIKQQFIKQLNSIEVQTDEKGKKYKSFKYARANGTNKIPMAHLTSNKLKQIWTDDITEPHYYFRNLFKKCWFITKNGELLKFDKQNKKILACKWSLSDKNSEAYYTTRCQFFDKNNKTVKKLQKNGLILQDCTGTIPQHRLIAFVFNARMLPEAKELINKYHELAYFRDNKLDDGCLQVHHMDGIRKHNIVSNFEIHTEQTHSIYDAKDILRAMLNKLTDEKGRIIFLKKDGNKYNEILTLDDFKNSKTLKSRHMDPSKTEILIPNLPEWIKKSLYQNGFICNEIDRRKK